MVVYPKYQPYNKGYSED